MVILPPVMKANKDERISRPQQVANAIKELIVSKNLAPGDRLPNEIELIEQFEMAKGTIREAIRILEAQGLVKTRTGPKGGAFVNAPSEYRTQSLLANYFYFKDLSIENIYDLRQLLEPDMVAQLAPIITRAEIRQLEDIMDQYILHPINIKEETAQHISSLAFHAKMASFTKNEVLGFIIRFLTNVLTEHTVHHALFEPKDAELWTKGRDFQMQLLDAFRNKDSEKARKIMRSHMIYARSVMLGREINLSNGLL